MLHARRLSTGDGMGLFLFRCSLDLNLFRGATPTKIERKTISVDEDSRSENL
jgi:hypothetical protein